MSIQKQLIAGLVLGVAGFAGNWFRYPLFLNIDFLFGSFFVMTALLRYGTGAGILSGIIAGSCTWLIWKHPYAMIIFTVEAAVVGILNRKRKRADILLHDMFYWLCIGAALVWIFYHLILSDTIASTCLIMLKQSINGIFNALLASMLFQIIASREKITEKLPSFQQVVFTIMVSLVLIPAFLCIFYYLRAVSARESQLLARQTSRTANTVVSVVDAWLSEHHQIVTSLAKRIGNPDRKSTGEMQRLVVSIKDTSRDFQKMGVLDRHATTIAYDPLVDELGRSTIGLNYADRSYFKTLQKIDKPYVSGVLFSKQGNKVPVVPLLTPMFTGNKFNGYCVGVLQTGAIHEHLRIIIGNLPMHITILDQYGQVVVSTRNDRPTMTLYARPSTGLIRPISADLVQWTPPAEKGKNLMQRWAKSLYIAEKEISPENRWRVIVENSYNPLLLQLRSNATTALAGLVFLSLLTVPVSYLLSSRLTRSLEKLQLSTRSLPDDISRNLPVSLPESSIMEIAGLIDNFGATRRVLQDQHNSLQDLNRTLEERNASLIESEDALKAILARLSKAQKAASAGLWDWDIQTGKIAWSEELFNLFGLDPATIEPSLDVWLQVIVPDDREAAGNRLRDALDKRERMVNEYRIALPSGDIRWISAIGDTVYNDEGTPIRMSGICIDISERKQVEDRLNLLADTAGMLLVTDSPQDEVETLCSKALSILGCQIFFNFLVDKDSGRLKLNTCAGISDEEKESVRWLDYGVAVCGCAARDACRIVEEDIPNHPHNRTEIVHSFGIKAYACHPLMFAGEVIGTLSFGSSIRSHFNEEDLALMKAVTDLVAIALVRKRTEGALERAKKEWERTFDSLPDLVAILDEKHRIMRVNRSMALHLGMEPRECIGRFCYELVHGTDLPPVFCPYNHSLCDSQTHEVELYEESLGGDFLVSTTPLHDIEGNLIGTVHMARDISDRKRAEKDLQKAHDELEERIRERTAQLEQTIEMLQHEVLDRIKAESALKGETEERIKAVEILREQEKFLVMQSRHAAMGEMIGNIAHQWRQPLNILGLLIQQIQMFHEAGKCDGQYLGDSVRKGMEIIQHMSRTIDDFRNFFRPEKEPVLFSVDEAIGKAVSLVRDSFSSNMIVTEFTGDSGLMIKGFPNEFSQVMLNILINARDALLERKTVGPRISVAVDINNGHGIITVADNAGGIPDDCIGKIFDPYFTTKEIQKGTGLGLYMAKTIIEKNMNGILSVGNGDEGAEFRIEVECAQQQ